jgi:RNA polymerase sigma-70 factor (ECF subfamily)
VELIKELLDTDSELLEVYQANPDEALEVLFDRFSHSIYRVAFHCLGNDKDAVQVTYDTLKRACQNLEDFQGRFGLSIWLYRIVANLVRNRLRERRMNALDGEAGMVSALPQFVFHQDKSHAFPDDLQHGINMLPEQLRLAYVLKDFEQLTYRDIAKVLGCPLETVKIRINQARFQLRQNLPQR